VPLHAADAAALDALDRAARRAPDDPGAALAADGPVGWLAAQVDDDRARLHTTECPGAGGRRSSASGPAR